MAAFVCGLTYAAKSAVSGAIMGAVLGCLTSAFRGENALEGLRQGFVDGFADGFMWGGITAGLSNVVKPGSFCFIAGTKVLTDHGHKNIEDIEVGDLVLAYDEETGETAYKPVVTLFRNTTKEWCTVSVRGNDGELYEITSTPGHKYFVPGNRVRKDSRALEHASYAGLSEKWVSACDLKRGDKVLLSDGTLCEVEGVSCKKLSAPETTYNLEVADFHTYYVSDACVLVHNAGCSTRQGQNHHVITNKMKDKINTSNPNLRGVISRNDPRLRIRAFTKEGHRGYQHWHRTYDDVMVKWLENHENATPAQFIKKLNNYYAKPGMIKIFGKVRFK